MKLSGPEVAAICKGFDDNDGIYGAGIKIGGEKYFTIRADDKVLQGRKVCAQVGFSMLMIGRGRSRLYSD